MTKILLVDGEEIQRRALEMMIRSEFPGLEMVPSAASGLELIASAECYAPDIAIVNVSLPGISGLSALEMVRARNRSMKFILFSTQGDFETARKALALGASDYLLKPVGREELHRAVARALSDRNQESLQSEAADSRNQLQQMRQVVESEFLSSLLLGEPDEQSFALLCSDPPGFCGCALVCARCADPGSGQILSRKLSDQLVQEIKLFRRCIGRAHRGEICLLIFTEAGESEEQERQRLVQLLALAMQKIEKQGGPTLCFGISGRLLLPTEMTGGLAEARIAARGPKKPGVNFYAALKKQEKPPERIALANICARLLRENRLEDCVRTVHEAFDRGPIPPEELSPARITAMELVMLVSESILDGQDELLRYARSGRLDYSALNLCQTLQQLADWIEGCMRTLAAPYIPGEKKGWEYVRRCLIFMEYHYAEDMSLEQAAEASGVSPFYLSRLLKQALDQSFVQLLTQIRMREALHLIWEKRFTAREIAERTGYRNVTYFYKVFKRYTGMSTGDIRKYVE